MTATEVPVRILGSILANHWPVVVCMGVLFCGWIWAMWRVRKSSGASKGTRDAVHLLGVLFFLVCAVAMLWFAAYHILSPKGGAPIVFVFNGFLVLLMFIATGLAAALLFRRGGAP